MENAVEALKTAAAVLIFVIAITVAFTMFSNAKETADAVVKSQDTQEYLEAAELDSQLYTSSDAIGKDTIAEMTTKGDRIVSQDDVISTIYRYNLEKYGVTVVKSNGEVIARFDSNTENVMRQWYNIKSGTDADGNKVTAQKIKEQFAANIKNNISVSRYDLTPNLDAKTLEELYKISVEGNGNITCGAPWYGNETEIIKRINADIGGFGYTLNNQKYMGKGVKGKLDSANKIVEVVNQIDNSEYLNDETDGETSLLQQYQLPTIEIVYILY